MIKFLLKLFFIISLLFLVAGYFNKYHQLLDSISHFRVQLALIVAFFSLLLIFVYSNKSRYLAITFFIIMLIYIYYITLPYPMGIYKKVPGAKFTTIKHLQFNLNFRNSKMDNVINFLRTKKPDTVTLQEVTNSHKDKLLSLKKEYPYQRYCNFYPIVGGVAVLSKYPFTKDYICVEGGGLLISDVKIKDKTISIASIHLHWPYPYSQYLQVNNFLPYLKHMSKYKIISGDFNAAPWSYIVKKIANASNTNIVDGLRWTIELKKQLPYLPLFKLPIDQVLVSDNIKVIDIKTKEHLGSDHYPVLSTIKIPN